MKCDKCGKDIPDNAKFCRFCGTEAKIPVRTKACHSCGKTIYEDAKFCRYCGAQTQEKKQQRVCLNCGSPLKEGALFCKKCGARAAEQIVKSILKSFEAQASAVPGEVSFPVNTGGSSLEESALNKAIRALRGGI